MSELKADQSERLWQHALHEDTLFNERLNSYVSFQSVLLALAAALILARPDETRAIVRSVSVIGILSSLLTTFLQRRQASYVQLLSDRCREHFIEFAETLNLARSKSDAYLRYGYIIPLLFVIAWCVLLVF